MGTRLDISGSAADWDPDDHAIMADWVISRTSTVRKRIDHRTSATVLTKLPTINFEKGPDIKAIDDIMNRKRLRQIGTKGLSHSEVTTRRLVKEFYEARGWGGVSWGFYGRILMQLEEDLNPGGKKTPALRPVHCCGYDWRKSNADSGRTLVERIDQVLAKHKARQVILVTHSMGGLVARAAMARGATPKIAGVVHTVQPADGAVVAYRRFFTGAVNDLDGDTPLNIIMGNSPEEYLETQSGAQGPMQLLPHDSYPELWLRGAFGTNLSVPEVFDTYSSDQPPGILQPGNSFNGEIRARLGEAKAFSKSIAGLAHPITHVIVGDNVRTDVGFNWQAPRPAGLDPPPTSTNPDGANPVDIDQVRHMIDKQNEGDGTVPAVSAQFRGITDSSEFTFTATHAECFDVADLRNRTVDRVRNILSMM